MTLPLIRLGVCVLMNGQIMAKARMSSQDTVEEVDWLTNGGMSEYQICEALQKTPAAIAKAGWRSDRKDIYSRFEMVRREYR